jgi:hypothetical protein
LNVRVGHQQASGGLQFSYGNWQGSPDKASLNYSHDLNQFQFWTLHGAWSSKLNIEETGRVITSAATVATDPANTLATKGYVDSKVGGGGASVPPMVYGWPDAIKCESGVNTQLFYLSSLQPNIAPNGQIAYSDPYTHTGSGAGAYCFRFNNDGDWINTCGGAAGIGMAGCIGKSISELEALGWTFNFGGGGGRDPIFLGFPNTIICNVGGTQGVYTPHARYGNGVVAYREFADPTLNIDSSKKITFGVSADCAVGMTIAELDANGQVRW